MFLDLSNIHRNIRLQIELFGIYLIVKSQISPDKYIFN